MTVWFLLAMMTAAAVFAVLWPLRRGTGPRAEGTDIAVYRDQLDELERDRAAGLIGSAEAQAARVEIARRLIAAADAASADSRTFPASPGRRRATAVAALTLLPLGAVALYSAFGSPTLPGFPLAERVQTAQQEPSIERLIAQVEAHLERNPDDGRGWEVLAPVYMRLGRFDDAVKARGHALRLNGANAAREADYGEALVAAANGVVSGDAKAAFERATALNAGDVKARYFIALAAEQDGKREQAAAIWRELLAAAPADAPWTELVRRSLARLEAAPGGPGEDDIAAAAALSPQARSEMVRAMVQRLADRLKQDGSDIEGWQRLMRAYAVLGESEKARAAATDARQAMRGDADKLRRIDELSRTLGLDG